MSRLMQPFNPLQFDPTQGQPHWPVGRHPVVIESDEVKPTKSGDSGYVQLNLKAIGGDYAGFTGPYRLNLYNQSAEAVQIACKQLSAICHVTQTFQLGQDGTDLSALYNKPFVIEVVPQKGQEAIEKGYTEIKKVYDINGNEPGKQGQAQQQQQPQSFQAQQPAQSPQQSNNGGAQAWGSSRPQQQAQPQAQTGGWGGGQAQSPQNEPQEQSQGWQQGPQQQRPAWGQQN